MTSRYLVPSPWQLAPFLFLLSAGCGDGERPSEPSPSMAELEKPVEEEIQIMFPRS